MLVACVLVSPRLDADGVPLPPEAAHRVGSARWRHPGWQGPPVVSADGRHVFTHTDDNRVLVWEAETGRVLDRIAVPPWKEQVQAKRPHLGNPNLTRTVAVPFESKQHRRIELLPDGRLRVIDFAYGSLSVRTLDPATRRVGDGLTMEVPLGQTVELTPDGRLVAVHVIDVTRNVSIDHEAHALKVFDTATKKPAYAVPVVDRVYAYGFSPDGKLLAVSDTASLRLLDAATGKLVRTLHAAAGRPVRGLLFAPDSRSVAGRVKELVGDKHGVTIWRTDGTAIPTRISAYWYAPQSLAFRPGGRQLAVNTDAATWTVVDAATGRAESNIAVPRTFHHGGAYAPDGRRFYAVGVGYVRDDRPFSGTFHGGFLLPIDVTATPPAPAFDLRPNRHLGAFAAAGDYVAIHDSTLTRWHAATGRVTESRLPIHVTREHPEFAFSPAGDRFALAVPPDAAGTRLGTLEVVELTTNRRTTFDAGKAGAHSPVFSPDGATLFAHGGRELAGWSLATGKRFARPWPTVPLAAGSIASHSFDGRWAWVTPISLRSDSKPSPPADPFRVYDPNDLAKPVWVFRPSGGGDIALMSADGQRAVVAADGGRVIELWDRATNRRRWRTPVTVYSWTASPDERTLAGVHGPAVDLVEVASGRVRHRFVGLRGDARDPKFSPDGRLLATISPDAPVLLWDIRGELAKPRTPPDLSSAWADLASADAAVAFRAIRRLTWFPDQSLPLLTEKLPPAVGVADEKLAKLIAALDAPAFADRDAATKELKALADLAVPRLEAALKATESVEARSRIETLLEAIANRPRDGEYLRVVRAVEAVEWMRTPAAAELLAAWAGGAAGAKLTTEATAARDRGNVNK
jgi:WD40 repeat protein